MDIQAICELPISESDPVGFEARYESEYLAITAEVDKLSSMTNAKPDWSVVLSNSEPLLTKKTKDFTVVCYLAYALLKINGFEGFVDSITILLKFSQNFWENCFPSIKKIRRRVNIFEWWHEKAVTEVEQLLSNVKPIDAGLYLDVKNALYDLDAFMAENMEDASSLRDLIQLCERIPVITKEVEPEPEEVKVEEPSQETVTEPTPPPPPVAPQSVEPATPSQSTTAVPPSIPNSQPVKAVSVTSGDATFINVPYDFPLFPKLEPFTEEEEKAKKFYIDCALHYASVASMTNPQNPYPRLILRIACWGNIYSLPESNNNVTFIIPPDKNTISLLKNAYSSGNYMAAQKMGEDVFRTSLFYFDAQKIIADSLKQLGPDYAYSYKIVCDETYKFIKRLPGIERLSFAGGVPFASPATLEWLETIGTITVAVPSGSGFGAALSPIEEAIAQAEVLYKEENLKSALCFLDNVQKNGYNDEIQIKTAQINLLCKDAEDELSAIFADTVYDELLKNNLVQWDIDKAVKCLLALRKVYTNVKNQDKAEEIQRRIAALRPSEALNWHFTNNDK